MNKSKIRQRIAGGVQIVGETGCWNWEGVPRENGYCRTSFERKAWYVHRMSYFVFIGDIPEGNDVCHHCDNRRCCNPAHLFTGSRKVNMEDAVKKNRQAQGEKLSALARGEKSYLAKLKDNDILEIRKMKKDGNSTKKIAEIYCVSADNIRRIVRKDTWRHI